MEDTGINKTQPMSSVLSTGGILTYKELKQEYLRIVIAVYFRIIQSTSR